MQSIQSWICRYIIDVLVDIIKHNSTNINFKMGNSNGKPTEVDVNPPQTRPVNFQDELASKMTEKKLKDRAEGGAGPAVAGPSQSRAFKMMTKKKPKVPVDAGPQRANFKDELNAKLAEKKLKDRAEVGPLAPPLPAANPPQPQKPIISKSNKGKIIGFEEEIATKVSNMRQRR